MIEIKKYGNFKNLGKQKTKKQIILIHTSRNLKDYFSSLLNRFNGKYNKIPHYVVSREGEIHKLLENTDYSGIFLDPNINRNSIVICLENLGWLNKEPLKDYYVNWIGDIYNEKIVDKKWRDYFFWQPYTENQIKSTVFLCKQIIKECKLSKEIIQHNTKINGIERFEGIVTRSNFDSDLTDLSPAFDFEHFINLMENE